jgi:hypothetical protein
MALQFMGAFIATIEVDDLEWDPERSAAFTVKARVTQSNYTAAAGADPFNVPRYSIWLGGTPSFGNSFYRSGSTVFPNSKINKINVKFDAWIQFEGVTGNPTPASVRITQIQGKLIRTSG